MQIDADGCVMYEDARDVYPVLSPPSRPSLHRAPPLKISIIHVCFAFV
jgi:hypothetical protein